MQAFRINDEIPLTNGRKVRIVSDRPLGGGGQGEVYLVDYKGEKCALKWYTAEKIKRSSDTFMKNLENNVSLGAPTDQFLWPIAVTQKFKESFGYVMPLIPDGYESFSDILRTYKLEKRADGTAKRVPVRFSSLEALVKTGLNMVYSFRSLHRNGLSYQDLNDGGVFVNMETGDIAICDCDNVAPDKENLGISGKPGYMAPEVVVGKERPDTRTDRFSLAVMLFKLLFNGDPLDGAKVQQCVLLTGSAELEHYGRNPIFVYDPNDGSNRPVRGVHNNVIKKWSLYPEYIRQAFIRSFTIGLRDPDGRIIENEWFRNLLRLMNDIVNCNCGAGENFLSCTDSKDKYTCPACKRTFCILSLSGNRTVENDRIALTIGAKIYGSKNDSLKEFGEVIENKNHPGVLGLRNMTEDEWEVHYSGEPKKIPSGKTAVINDSMDITFNKNTKATTKVI